MAAVCVVGATGLVGAQILAALKKTKSVGSIHAFSRKQLPIEDNKITISSRESTSWPSEYPPGQTVFFSALGTTRAQAGGFDKQRAIDFDLNLDLAKAAHAFGTKVYVLISSAGADSSSLLGYPKMKGELEEAVQGIGFEHVVILRPGLLCGQRASHDSRPAEFALRKVADVAGSISGGRLKDFWAQDDDVIARAAISAGLDCISGRETAKVRILSQADIVRLGRKEWSDSGHGLIHVVTHCSFIAYANSKLSAARSAIMPPLWPPEHRSRISAIVVGDPSRKEERGRERQRHGTARHETLVEVEQSSGDWCLHFLQR